MDSSPEKYTGAFKKISYSRKEIFNIIKSVLGDNNKAYDMLHADVSEKMKHPYIFSNDEKHTLSKLMSEFRKKWKETTRRKDLFFKKFGPWLSVIIFFTIGTRIEDNSTMGRPLTSWEDLSDRSKRRRIQNLRADHSLDELAYATQMSLRASGQLDASKVIKDVAESSPSKASSYRKSAEHVQPGFLSSNEALSILVEAKLSKSQYNVLRSAGVEKNNQLFPSYKKVLESKNKCYPEKSEITITESGASVTLQALLNHTVERILLTKSDVTESISKCDFDKVQLICKWGCDGTSGQSMYKQKFQDDNLTDDSIFFISLVPLELACAVNPEIIIWKNPRTSTRFCRSIKIYFLHETPDATRKEVASIEAEQETLVPYSTVFQGRKLTVNFKLSMTMVDGKIINSVTETSSSMRCYLCQATSKEFNHIDKILQKPINEDNLEFGISSLHAWIRFFECCLHLSYKIELKKWQSRGEDKEIVENRKKIIQDGFRMKLGLRVDCPKQGYGSTNDGNTARRFFENYEISASITGVNKDLIKQFHVILQVISCGFKINVEEFKKYTENTARKFVELYPWYFMSTTVHKILIHGHKIIESSLLPIGQMSEEAQESCNKFIKRYREDFARKCDRVKNMEDVFYRLLVSSDPLISTLRKLPVKKLKSLSRQAQDLLLPVSHEQSFYDVLSNVTAILISTYFETC